MLAKRYLGYLPQHYAEGFVSTGRMLPMASDRFQYVCQLSAIVRRSLPPSQVVATLLEALVAVH